MKASAVCLLICSFCLYASASTPERVQFIGSVQQDDMTPFAFDLQLPSKQAATLQLSDGFTLELTAPGSSASPDGARIRLLSSTGQVMHTAVIPDSGMASTSFAYRVCANEVTYMSPAPAAAPVCGA